MAVGPQQLRKKVAKYITEEVRYRVSPGEIDELLFQWLTTPTEEIAIDPTTRDGLVTRFALQFLHEEGLDDEEEKQRLLHLTIKRDPTNPRHVAYMLFPAIKCLEELEELDTAVNAKIERLQQDRHNPVLRMMFWLAYDWRLSFGFAGAFKVDLEKRGKSKTHATKYFLRFVDLLEVCSKRRGINDKIRQRMRRTLEALPVRCRKWCYRVLMRDMRVRVKRRTLYRVWPRMIPAHPMQLCDTIKKDAPRDHFEPGGGIFPKHALMAPKLDGLRLGITVENARSGKGVVRSRKGLELPHLAFLLEEASLRCLAMGLRSVVFDGEASKGDSRRWNDAQSAVHTLDQSEEERNLRVNIFDAIPLAAFMRGEGAATRRSRLARLQRAFEDPDLGGSLHLIEMVEVPERSTSRTRKFVLRQYQRYRDRGYEGAIIYDLDAPYNAGDSTSDRRASGIKRIKPFNFVDVTIVKAVIGKGSNSKRLGAFVCETEDGVMIRVGGGFKEWERERFWEQRRQLVGRTIEVERQEDTPGIKSRHANFRRLRPKGDK